MVWRYASGGDDVAAGPDCCFRTMDYAICTRRAARGERTHVRGTRAEHARGGRSERHGVATKRARVRHDTGRGSWMADRKSASSITVFRDIYWTQRFSSIPRLDALHIATHALSTFCVLQNPQVRAHLRDTPLASPAFPSVRCRVPHHATFRTADRSTRHARDSIPRLRFAFSRDGRAWYLTPPFPSRSPHHG